MFFQKTTKTTIPTNFNKTIVQSRHGAIQQKIQKFKRQQKQQ